MTWKNLKPCIREGAPLTLSESLQLSPKIVVIVFKFQLRPLFRTIKKRLSAPLFPREGHNSSLKTPTRMREKKVCLVLMISHELTGECLYCTQGLFYTNKCVGRRHTKGPKFAELRLIVLTTAAQRPTVSFTPLCANTRIALLDPELLRTDLIPVT